MTTGEEPGHRKLIEQRVELLERLFEHSPVEQWELDCSQFRTHVNGLAEAHGNAAAYLTERPDEIARCHELIAVTSSNLAAERMTSPGPKEPIRKSGDCLGSPGYYQLCELVLLGLARGELNQAGETEMVTEEGPVRRIRFTFVILPESIESWDRALLSVIDVTDHSLAETLREQSNRLEQASRAKGEFLANMSHEFRTPLTNIVALAELLQQPKIGDDLSRRKELLSSIRVSGIELLDMVTKALDVALFASGRMEFHTEDVDLSDATLRVAQRLFPLAQRKGILLEVSPDVELGTVRTDWARLDEVISALLGSGNPQWPHRGNRFWPHLPSVSSIVTDGLVNVLQRSISRRCFRWNPLREAACS